MGFFDLNLPYETSQSSKTTRLKLVVKAMELGYTGVAFNHTIKGVMSDRDRCSIVPFSLSSLLNCAPSLASSVNFHRDLLGIPPSSPFRQYSRLTVCVDNPAKSLALNSGNSVLKTYDLVAVRPLNQAAFDHACEKAEVDMISVDFSEKVPFRLKQPMVKAAIQRGVYFEITYSDLIVDVQVRRQMVSNAKMLVDWTRGRNIILSSGAPSVTELRGPCDVANLLSLLGLSAERAKAATSKNCRNLLAIALRKKHFHKEAIRVEVMPLDGKSDPKAPLSVDWLKWDPISSGEGDLQLEDMAKSFSAAAGISKSVKAIDFTSVIDSIASQDGSLLTSLKAVDVQVATAETSKKLSRNDFPKSNENSVCNSSSKNQVLDFKSSQVANLPANAVKSCNCANFPVEPFPLLGTQSLDLQSQNSFHSSESDVTLPHKDSTCQESAMDVGLSSLFVSDNKVNLPKDLAFHDKQIDKIRDSQDLDVVPSSEHCVMNSCTTRMDLEDQNTIVSDVSNGEIEKSVENEITLVDHLQFSVASNDIRVTDFSSTFNEAAAMKEQKSEEANLEILNEYRVVNHETQEEATMEKQEQEYLNEQTLESFVIDDHIDVDTEILLGVDRKSEVEENFVTSMEVELKKPKHEEAGTQSNIPWLLPSLPEKSKAKGRTIFQPLKFPIRRLLNPTPFKRKSRKSKRKRA